MFEGELVQTADGGLARRHRDEFGPPLDKVPFEPVEPAFDLRVELERLRVAPPIVRPMSRVARIEMRAGDAVVTFSYARPMKGDVQTDHPADRLYAALWGWP